MSWNGRDNQEFTCYRVSTAVEPDNLAHRVEVAIQENYPEEHEQTK